MKQLLPCPPAEAISTQSQRDRIEAHLEELLASRAFRGSRRACEFLRYIVSETLADRGAQLKERNIAIDVFHKGEDFDAQHESIVRVNAADVRKRLAQYYEEQPGGTVGVELPVGCYQPVFHVEAGATAQVPVRPIEPKKKRLWLPWLLAPAAVLSLAWTANRTASPEDLLWRPFAAEKTPVLISLPAPAVYQIDRGSEARNREGYFVGTGAAYGAAKFGEQLARRGQTFTMKYGNDVVFADLKQAPAILLGAYTSFWTMEITRHLPYRIEHDADGDEFVDTVEHRSWKVSRELTGERTEGYALVTRLLQSETGHPLLMAAGMSQPDTQASVEFLTNPRAFEQFARTMGPDWSRRNFQLVLHSYVHGHSPGAPTVVAYRVW
jgi:hypothetical protein